MEQPRLRPAAFSRRDVIAPVGELDPEKNLSSPASLKSLEKSHFRAFVAAKRQTGFPNGPGKHFGQKNLAQSYLLANGIVLVRI